MNDYEEKAPWVGKLCSLRRQIQKQEAPRQTRSPKEQVVNSVHVKWRPIDRVAARVIAKAHWLEKPDAFGKRFNQQPKETKMKQDQKCRLAEEGKARISQIGKYNLTTDKIDANGEPLYSLEQVQKIEVAMAEDLSKRASRDADEMVARAQAARAVVNEACEGLGADIQQFKEVIRAHTEAIRGTRVAVLCEIREIAAPLREIRQFFMGPDYKDEIARLQQFVELCERLKALKDDGFLDKVADTILNLA